MPLPWSDILKPVVDDEILVRRVENCLVNDFRWFRDAAGREGLLLVVPANTLLLERLPVFRDMKLERVQLNESVQLRWTLFDRENVDVFLTFCKSLLERCRDEEAHRTAAIAVGHTNSWRRLLGAARSPLLTERQQLGLLGELIVFKRVLEQGRPEISLIDAWVGPEQAPRDFEFSDLSIEAKAVSPEGNAKIRISSEYQLEQDGTKPLFVAITSAERTDEEYGLDITACASRIMSELDSAEAKAAFSRKLELAGLHPDHDYSGQFWTVISTHYFAVADEFPKLISQTLHHSISRVSYELSIGDLSEFVCLEAEVFAHFVGELDT